MSKVTVSLSPTSLGTWNESQLLFFLKYIIKQEPDTKVPEVYGIAGNIVHELLESYANEEMSKESVMECFEKEWQENKLDDIPGIFGNYLKKPQYESSVTVGMHLVDDYRKDNTLICEKKYKWLIADSQWFEFYLSGIVDMQVVGDDVKVVDWKTSSKVDTSGQFRLQALFYCFMIHKDTGKLPKSATFHYVKINKTKTYEFEMKDLDEFKEMISGAIQTISNNELDIANYDVGKIDTPFNSHLAACKKEELSR